MMHDDAQNFTILMNISIVNITSIISVHNFGFQHEYNIEVLNVMSRLWRQLLGCQVRPHMEFCLQALELLDSELPS